MHKPLEPQDLRKTYTSDEFKSISESIPKHRKAIIGQKRAVKALRFGLGNRAPGFNVYVSAPDGDGKISTIRHFLAELAERDPVPPDWIYVNQFKDPYCPNAIRMPRGAATQFNKDIKTFISDARKALVKTLESEEYQSELQHIKQDLTEKQQEIFTEIEQKAQDENFMIKGTPMEVLAIPMVDNKQMTEEEFNALSSEEKQRIRQLQRQFQVMVQNVVRKTRELEKKTSKQLAELERQAALYAIEGLLEDLLERYAEIDEVPAYLDAMKNDILDNLQLFFAKPKAPPVPQSMIRQEELHQRYEINVFVDNGKLDKAPIVTELNPTYNNLFGKIERESIMGTLVTNFTLIRPGALHKANGGYLIIPVDDLLRAPFSWETLKRCLRNGNIEIEDPTERLGFISAKSLKPEPIPLNVQVILIGRRHLFQLLYHYDDDFKELFKVKADFDFEMPATEENLKEICGMVIGHCMDENLLTLDSKALVKVLEHGHRLANHQQKITTKLEEIADIVREADFYARQDQANTIDAPHIMKAIREKINRSDLMHEKIKELVHSRVIAIDVSGEKTGQVNGLSVIDIGDLMFGRPSRITATVGVGKSGIIDIEREVKMGGPIHSKGVMILSGFLFDKFGRDKPITLTLRLVFEQSYGGVDGDSASSTELYAILSELSGVPIKQSVAVTGSVNQRGQVQAVGGINEKIEGYYEVCKRIGLNGEQGVMIPASNRVNLMLKEEVIDAVRQGLFHIWAVETIEEGIEVLMGTEAGSVSWNASSEKLEFTPGSIYDKTDQSLRKIAERLVKFGKDEEGPENENP